MYMKDNHLFLFSQHFLRTQNMLCDKHPNEFIQKTSNLQLKKDHNYNTQKTKKISSRIKRERERERERELIVYLEVDIN